MVAMRIAQTLWSSLRVAAITSFLNVISRATRQATLLLFAIAVLLGDGAVAVRGQSALDGFDSNANGTVRVVVVQPDGKILIGGEFTGANSIGGQARNNIARLDPVTGLANSWDPNASSYVYSPGCAVTAPFSFPTI
jgi:hypothetical protein